MQDSFKKIFIVAIKYLPVVFCTMIAIVCCNGIFMWNLIVYPASIQTLFLLLCLSFVFKYCQYHKVLLLFSISFWVLYQLHLLIYGILIIYLFGYIILMLYGIKNKI